MQNTQPKKNWLITSESFARLLEWIDEGVDSNGQKYLELRRKLFAYFDRKNCLSPDELADETLNRVARRLEEEGKIESETPAKFCYVTARFVFLESLRDKENKNVSIDEIKAERFTGKDADEEKILREKMLACLEKCVGELDETKRELIVKYYYGAERIKIENRRTLAEQLGISSNALTIRACRIRDRLEICVRKCAEKEE
jgi:DNA-directed RNA polymerase specialized sigma24 family protein